MKNKMIKIGIVLIVLAMVAGCSEEAPTEPTPDVNAIKTEAVKTAMAEMTVQAALSPSETPLPPTLTPLPTATLSEEAAQPAASSSGSGTSGGGSSSGSGSVDGTPLPTWTPDVYMCEIEFQTPDDGPATTGANFDVTWTVRNVSTAVWDTTNYYFKWMPDDGAGVESADLSPHHIYKLPHDVGYWETVDLTIDVQIPTKPFLTDNGLIAYVTNWAIVNDNGEAFCRMYYSVTLTLTPVPTQTDTPTP